MERPHEDKRQRTVPLAARAGAPPLLLPAQQAEAGSGHPTPVASTDPSRIWLPELVQRFASFLPPNDVPCLLRLVNKAAAAQFSRPRERAIRLSLPVPHGDFVRRWGGAGAGHRPRRSQRPRLPCLVARSGSIANLEVLLARSDGGAVLESAVLFHAAAAGHLEVVRWLRQRGCPHGTNVLSGAARAGHQAVCEWLVEDGCPHDVDAAGEAARGGHVGLMDWLLEVDDRNSVPNLLAGAAAGCDLPTLQRLCQYRLLTPMHVSRIIAGAAASCTADWRAKVEWLMGRDHPRTSAACEEAAQLPDGPARLEWLRLRGYPLRAGAAVAAARAGNVEALQLVMGAGVGTDARTVRRAVRCAAAGGHVAVLQSLLRVVPGFTVAALPVAATAAASAGRLLVVEWLVEARGAAEVLSASVFESAVLSGSMELLAWLHARGCPWDASVFTAAVACDDEEQLEWLAARGCPMGEDGAPYTRAVRCGGLPMLRCLRRLGCPWGPPPLLNFTLELQIILARANPAPTTHFLAHHALPTLLWLLDEGCTVDWDAVVASARGHPVLLAWLQQQRGQRQPQEQ